LEAIEYGFFDATISVRIVEGKRRELVISAGKSYKFHIPEGEVR
jgi:hypothetical protein